MRTTDTDTKVQRGARRWAAVVVPVVLIAVAAWLLVRAGAGGIFPGEFPPVEDLSFGRVTLSPGEIEAVVTNGGPSPVTISQVLVDEAFWAYDISGDSTLDRLESRTITIAYPWVEGEPVTVKILSSNGVPFEHSVAVATETPATDLAFLGRFALLGIYIGLVPIVLGMLFLPFLRTLGKRWLHFFMAFTAGVLIFLGVETLAEALEAAESLPTAAGGIGVVALGAIGSFLLILAASRWMRARSGSDKRVIIAVMVAAGIGMHNMGEGLAVGAAYRLGEIALGAFLVIGFAIHNTTEGIGIVSILADRANKIRTLAGLALLAGLPTVLGAWIGAFFFSPVLAAVFLAVAAGAIAEVVVDVLGVVRAEAQDGLMGWEVLTGTAAGLAVMYLTGLLVAA